MALVTGAAPGIGRAAALALADAGYDLMINYSARRRAAQLAADEARRRGARSTWRRPTWPTSPR